MTEKPSRFTSHVCPAFGGTVSLVLPAALLLSSSLASHSCTPGNSIEHSGNVLLFLSSRGTRDLVIPTNEGSECSNSFFVRMTRTLRNDRHTRYYYRASPMVLQSDSSFVGMTGTCHPEERAFLSSRRRRDLNVQIKAFLLFSQVAFEILLLF